MRSSFQRPATLWRRRPLGQGLAALLVLALGTGVAVVHLRSAHAATQTVSNCSLYGPGAGTLAAALAAAGTGDTITFTCSGSIPVSTMITINTTLTFDATGQSVALDGGGLVQVFTVNSGGNLTLDHLTIANGNVAGSGGGVDNHGTLNITNSTFSGNVAGSGGGVSNAGGGGTVTITDSTFSGNSATVSGAGGGGVDNESGTLSITNSTVSGNSAISGGGVSNAGTLSITNSELDGNTVTESAMNGEAAGGAMDNAGTATVIGSTFDGNQATATGIQGIAVGGALFNGGGASATVANSTFVSNMSQGTGTQAIGRGGALYNAGGSATLVNNTIVSNAASGDTGTYGGGIGTAAAGSVSVVNSIVALNPKGADCGGPTPVTDKDYNLTDTSDASCAFTASHDVSTSSPGLGLPAKNGGPTETIALLAGSPALDAANDSVCAAAPVNGTDQRGVSRPQGAHCDIGAYERAVTTTTLTGSPNPGTHGQAIQFCATVASSASAVLGAPGGTLSFQEGATTLGTATLSGGQGCFSTSSLSIGSHDLTASYGGASGYGGSTSAPLTEVVGVIGQDVAATGSGSVTTDGNTATGSTQGPTAGTTAGNTSPASQAAAAGTTNQHQSATASATGHGSHRQPSSGGFGWWWLLGLLLLLGGLGGLGAVLLRARRTAAPGQTR